MLVDPQRETGSLLILPSILTSRRESNLRSAVQKTLLFRSSQAVLTGTDCRPLDPCLRFVDHKILSACHNSSSAQMLEILGRAFLSIAVMIAVPK